MPMYINNCISTEKSENETKTYGLWPHFLEYPKKNPGIGFFKKSIKDTSIYTFDINIQHLKQTVYH